MCAKIDFNVLDIEELINYIVNKHHAYCKQMLPLICRHLTAAAIDEKSNVSVKLIMELLADFRQAFDSHLRKEQHILFPFAQKLLVIQREKINKQLSRVPLVEHPIHTLQAEHDKAMSIISVIRHETHNYTPLKTSSTNLKLCYSELYEFEKELHKQMFIEDKILFPKIIALEKELHKRKYSQLIQIPL